MMQVVRTPLLPEPTCTTTFKSTLWGPTCDSADCVYKVRALAGAVVGVAEGIERAEVCVCARLRVEPSTPLPCFSCAQVSSCMCRSVH